MEVIRETLWKRCLSTPTKPPAKNSNICLSETAYQHKATRKKCKKTNQGAIIQWQRQCLMDKPHRKRWPKSKTSENKQSPSPLHHTFLLRRASFTTQPLSAWSRLIGMTGSNRVTGVTRMTRMTRVTRMSRLTGMTGSTRVTGVTRMTWVTSVTRVTRMTRMPWMTMIMGLRGWGDSNGMKGMTRTSAMYMKAKMTEVTRIFFQSVLFNNVWLI